MHFQTTVPNWPNALVKMPDGALLKSVNDPAILVDGVAKWAAAGRDPNQLWTCFRHHDFDYTFSTDFAQMAEKWRMNFRRFVDATYLREYAQYVRLVSEANEYTDSRMVTDKTLLAPFLTSTQAAVWVWNNEYRGRTIEVDGVEGHIREDCRLVINDGPVGNDIAREFFSLSVNEDAPLGVHLYTHWVNKQRDPLDFRYHSGRCYYNEQQYGIKPIYVITESGPYDGTTLNGWRHTNVMGGDVNLLIQGMRDWFLDLQQTAAYQEGRILGPGAWFTSSRSDDQWDYYRLWESELEPLADLAMQLWHPGSAPPPIPPPPADDFASRLWEDSLAKQTMKYNVSAALQKAIFRDGFVPVMNEDRFFHAEKAYAEQAAEHLNTGERRVYYAEVGDWSNVRYIVDSGGIGGGDESFHFEAWPTEVREYTQGFGKHPEYYARYGLPGHNGVDIVAPMGSPYFAAVSGKVIWSSPYRVDGDPSDYGWHIKVQSGARTILYAHAEEYPPVEMGDYVEVGEVIGYSGNTGESTGPHLHMELRHCPGDPGWPWCIRDITPYLESIK